MRVSQLVSTSIPRAFGAVGSSVVVVTLDASGPIGTEALSRALGSAGASEVVVLPHALDRTWAAAVVVLPGVVTPALTRSAVYAGLCAGAQHVSLVHGFGPDAAELARTVATTTDRPRRTRLAELLTAG